MKLIFFLLFLGFFGVAFGNGQPDTLRLTLTDVVELAKGNSIASKQAVTTRETRYWQWRLFKSNYNPQLSLSGTLPGYSKTSQQVIQPDGTIQFQPIHYDNSQLTLNFSQSITATGATIYGMSQLQRFNDLDRKNILYNGMPYAIGLSQPLGQFNKLKWDKKIQPLLYNESIQAYIEAKEQIAIKATGYFFDLLLAQVNLQIAETNFANTTNILKIANTKFDMGKVSRNELLQLQLELLNARKATGVAKRDLEVASLALRSYIGQEGNTAFKLIVPQTISQTSIPADSVLSQAYANRSDAIGFIRRINEAKRDVALAKGETGLTASLTANLGFSNSARNIPDIYRSPQNQQLVQLTFSLPIMDWGRSKSRIKTAEANQQFTTYAVEQDKQTFKQEIITQVTLFDQMKDQVGLSAEADSIAGEKYKIAKERYVLGNMSITDLSIAFQDNDRAKRDHVSALRDLWGAYYQLRYLSLYDFENKQKIKYQ
ncbi:MAG: TolC family protein [Bacteroidota bacterium]